MLSILVSVFALGFIIAFHELGHFLFARLFHVGIIEFSVGMGPRILSRVRGATRYSLRLLPFGGSCMMLGEEDEETETDPETGSAGSRKLNEIANGTFSGEDVTVSEDTVTVDGRVFSRSSQFYAKPAWQRLLIILGGPLFNLVLALLLSVVVTAWAGWDRPVIIETTEGSPAFEAGIRGEDSITSLEICGRKSKILTARDIQLFFAANASSVADGEEITVTWKTPEGEQKSGTLQAELDEESGKYLIGLTYRCYYEPCRSFGELLRMSLHNITYCFDSTIESLRMMFRGEVSGQDVKGVVGMVALMEENVEEAAQYSISDAFLTLINMMLILSASLGIMNLLPVPALDGGRLLFILIELVTRRAVPKKVEGYIHAAGTVLLLLLMVLILLNDVKNLMV